MELKDLTQLKTYTIDDESTLEIDDAISLENIGSNFRLWIHIASPALHFNIGSKIDLQARESLITKYLTDSTSYMFPQDLIKNKLSISSTRENLTLSVCVQLNDYGEIIYKQICLAVIKSNYRLTYEDADYLIYHAPKEEKELEVISRILSTRKNWRKRNGSLKTSGTQGRIIKEKEKLNLIIIEESLSRDLVEESMILFGFIIADFSRCKNIIIPYRCQDKCTIRLRQYYEHYCLRNSDIKRKLKKAYYSLTPFIHSSLGLEVYTHCTSPIRRYIDLITHYQITSYLSSNRQIDQDEVNYLVDLYILRSKQYSIQSSEDEQLYNQLFIYKSAEKYHNCYFLRWANLSKRIAQIYFIDLFIECKIYLDTSKDINIGEKINLSVKKTKMISQKNVSAILKMVVN